MGYEVTETEDGGQAWSNLEFGYFPIVISDWQMPDVDGPELCRRVRASAGERAPTCSSVTATVRSVTRNMCDRRLKSAKRER
jgi:CheY-like chemotaxis protein